MNKTRVHYTAPYIVNPQHRVTVDLVGLGGTGSQALTRLGFINEALTKLGHPGLHVRAWDGDTVSESNVGRQAFYEADIGLNKATVLVSRLNRAMGFDWEAQPYKYGQFPGARDRCTSNITVTCVDTIKARVDVGARLKAFGNKGITGDNLTRTPYYWLDFGNAQKTGQVVLGTIRPADQPADVPEALEAVSELPHVMKLFPNLKKQKDEDSGPSCSLAEALHRQDLFINGSLCLLGMSLLWKLFREYRVYDHGAYLNLDTLTANPIKI